MTELTIGALAKRTGVTVRTLHHYDEIGLLSPSGRTEAGYRLYSDVDILRLQRIVLLRGLGMPLEAIASALEGTADTLLNLLEQQVAAIDSQLRELRTAHARLTESIAQLRSHDYQNTDDALALIEAVAAFQRHFTDEQREALRRRAADVGADRIRAVEARWPQLIAEVRREMDGGTPPRDPRVLALAEEWQSLLDEFTGGRADIAHSAGRLMRTEPAAQQRMSGMGLTAEVMDYVAEAMGVLGSV